MHGTLGHIRIVADTGMNLLRLHWPAMAHRGEGTAVDRGGVVSARPPTDDCRGLSAFRPRNPGETITRAGGGDEPVAWISSRPQDLARRKPHGSWTTWHWESTSRAQPFRV